VRREPAFPGEMGEVSVDQGKIGHLWA
jgi:hypothetical protein